MPTIPSLKVLTLRALCRSKDFGEYATPEILERLSDRASFIHSLRKAVTTRMKIHWKDKKFRRDARTLAATFASEIPRHVWLYYFAEFGPEIKIDKAGNWLDTEMGQVFAEYFPNPVEAKQRMKQYEQRRKEENMTLANMFQVPTKKLKQFLERPCEYFDSWVAKDKHIEAELQRRRDNAIRERFCMFLGIWTLDSRSKCCRSVSDDPEWGDHYHGTPYSSAIWY